MATDSSSLANFLTQEEIPFKLRCACCNKLNVNAFRLLCCDQNICETCHANLPESCPVCMHTPVSADDCKPNKALRLTVKAFVKSEEKKRDKQNEENAPSRAESAAIPDSAQSPSKAPLASSTNDAPGLDDLDKTSGKAKDVSGQFSADELPGNEYEKDSDSNERERLATTSRESEDVHDPASRDTLERNEKKNQDAIQQQIPENAMNPQQTANSNFGMNMWNNNNFGYDNWANPVNFNPMMAMNNIGWTNFPNMMGMPSMGMDSMMMSQGMFGGFNGQGMNMNAMNGMGMGFNGNFNGWGNPNAIGYGGVNGNGFGANADYYPSNGYNQQFQQPHFKKMRSQQQFPMNKYPQTRHHGEGFGQQSQGPEQSQNTGPNRHDISSSTDQIGKLSEHLSSEKTPENGSSYQGTTLSQEKSDLKISSESDKPHGVEGRQNQNNALHGQENDFVPQELDSNVWDKPTDANYEQSTSMDGVTNLEAFEPQPISTIEPSDDSRTDNAIGSMALDDASQVQQGLLMNSLDPTVQVLASSFSGDPEHGDLRPRMVGNAAFGTHETSQKQPVIPAEMRGQGVEGAPTGPKAMRQGLSNTGFRGRGMYGTPNASRNWTSGHSIERGGKAPDTVTEQTYRERKNESVSRKRSASPAEHDGDRNYRSNSISNDDNSDHHRKRKRSHHYTEKEENPDSDKEDRRQRRRESSRESTSRRRSSDRERRRTSRHGRDRSKDRRKRHRSRSLEDRDSVHDVHNGRKEGRVQKSQRGPDRDQYKRDSHRERSRSPSDNRQDSRHYRLRLDNTKEENPTPQPREFKIKDQSKPSAVKFDQNAQEEEQTGPDVHMLEREARNRERMLKEQQRRESMTEGGRKGWSNHADNENGSMAGYRNGRRGSQLVSNQGRNRRMSYHYEDHDEDRALRVENEREAARWG